MVFEGGQFDTLVAMVAAGAGVTLLPEMARRHYQHLGVGLLDFMAPQPTRTVGLVRAKEKFVTPATRAFVDHVRKACVALGDRAPVAGGVAQTRGVPMARGREAKFLP
jgi:DNA-binding transcriptional LysR family regulator